MFRRERSPKIAPRPEIAALQTVVHGGFDHGELARLGLTPDGVLDFSVNRNPFGPPPHIYPAWQELHLERYPDRECMALRSALAERHQLTPEQIWVGNGTAELIGLLALAYLRPGDPLLVIGPTFGEYARAGGLMGARVEIFAARQQDGFRPDLDQLAARLDELRPRLVFLCNPNNPTGVYLEQAAVEALLAANPAGLLVLDEAYVPFVARAWSSASLLETGRVVVLHSMTKDYALAGLRLGYLLASAGIVEAIQRVQPPWSVNAVAQAVGLSALQEVNFLHTTLAQTAAAKAELVKDLAGLGLHAWPSATHFFLVEVAAAAVTRAGLLQRGILVRDCTSFGLPTFVRVATRRSEENRQLVRAWREFLRESANDG